LVLVKRNEILLKTANVVAWVCPMCGKELSNEKLPSLAIKIRKHCVEEHGEEVVFEGWW